MTVVPFKRKRDGGEPPREAPQIDHESLMELLGVFLDLGDYIRRERDPLKCIELYGIAKRLGDKLQQSTQPPKGAI